MHCFACRRDGSARLAPPIIIIIEIRKHPKTGLPLPLLEPTVGHLKRVRHLLGLLHIVAGIAHGSGGTSGHPPFIVIVIPSRALHFHILQADKSFQPPWAMAALLPVVPPEPAALF